MVSVIVEEFLKPLFWLAVIFSWVAVITALWVGNGLPTPKSEDPMISKHTEGGYECIVYKANHNSATCKEIEK